MPIWFKIENKIFKLLDKVQQKELLPVSKLTKEIWIWRATYYRLKEDKKASPSTIKKIKKFLEEKWYLEAPEKEK